MKILYLSSNLSNESGGYAESSFLLREKLDMLKNTDAYFKSRSIELCGFFYLETRYF